MKARQFIRVFISLLISNTVEYDDRPFSPQSTHPIRTTTVIREFKNSDISM